LFALAAACSSGGTPGGDGSLTFGPATTGTSTSEGETPADGPGATSNSGGSGSAAGTDADSGDSDASDDTQDSSEAGTTAVDDTTGGDSGEPAVCGNAMTEPGEDCDDGAQTVTCDEDCTAVACGDGLLNAAAGESCDDGMETATCDLDCTAAQCGDGSTNLTAGETCDDGGESATCNADCSISVCGDGILNRTAGEECDDNGTMGGDGCSATCLMEADPQCGLPYENLTLVSRNVGQGAATRYCDETTFLDGEWNGAGWHRFTGAAGTQMPEAVPAINTCGTHAPGWLNGTHPTPEQGVVARQVCFNWNGDTCNWSANVEVVNCSGFYLYNLPNTPACHLRYCAE